MDAEEIATKYDDDLRKMKTVTGKTDYETGATICQLGDDKETRHMTPIVVGDKNRVITPGCDFGSRKATIHAHPSQPPSKEDFEGAKTEQFKQCLLAAEPKDADHGILMCMEGDSQSDTDKAFRPPENKDDSFKPKDIERIEDAGFNVSTSSL